MKGYKGFNKDLKCLGFQYEVGKEFTHEGKVEVCERGFHFCTDPLDVFRYYNPASSRFCEVESTGDERTHGEDSKVATSKLRVVAEIGLAAMIKLGVKVLYEKILQKGQATSSGYSAAATSGYQSTAATSGYYSTAATSGYQSTAATSGDQSTAATSGDQSTAATSGYQSTAATSGYQSTAATSGDYSTAATSGYRSTAATSGDQSTAVVTGEESIAVSTGYNGRAKGALGCWLVLAERDRNGNILVVKTAKVDGEKIKADTLYTLVFGEFVEVIE